MSGAALYLRLLGQGLRLRLVEHPADLTGYRVRVAGLEALPATDQEEARQLILEHKPALVAFMRSGSPAAVAVRQEATYDSTKRSKREAT